MAQRCDDTAELLDRANGLTDADIKPILGGPHVDEATGRVWQPEDTDKATGPFVIGKLARVLADRRLRQAEQRQAEPAASAGALHVSRDFVDPVGKKQSRAVGSGMVFA